MAVTIILLTQVYAQNQELRTELKESKRIEKVLLEHVNKAEEKLSVLHEDYDKLKVLSGTEELETQINLLRRKFNDVKSEFGSIDVIKIHCIEEVKSNYTTSHVAMYVCDQAWEILLHKIHHSHYT